MDPSNMVGKFNARTASAPPGLVDRVAGPLTVALEELQRGLMNHLEHLAALRERLGPVLAPLPPTAPTPTGKELPGGDGTFAFQVMEIARQVEVATAVVEGIRDRLQF